MVHHFPDYIITSSYQCDENMMPDTFISVVQVKGEL